MMEAKYLTLTKENIDSEHICCGFSDKKCSEGYNLKKAWLKKEFDKGYVFRRLEARAKVFIEYVPAENAWIAVDAPGYLMVNCFWVSGQYKGHGHAKALLQSAIDDAKAQGKRGLVTVVGTKKFHFMGETKWLIKQGFETSEKLSDGFSLLVLKLDAAAPDPAFKACVRSGECEDKAGLVIYYTNRCPMTHYYVNEPLRTLAEEYGIPLKIIKLETMEQAQEAPTPATIFSAFYNGVFLTTDLSLCTPSKFVKLLGLKAHS